MLNVKKISALLLAMLMLISLVACKASVDPGPVTADPTTAGSNDPTKVEEPTSTEATRPTELEEGFTLHENTFFTVAYREEDGWSLTEDDFYMSEYGGNAYVRNLNDDGYTGLLIKIQADEESASSFRYTLHENDVDMKAYVEGTWVSETIGGLYMAAVDKEDGEWHYFGRDEAAGVSYSVTVSDVDDPRVDSLLQTIRFTAPATDNVDPPWPWEGEAFSAGTTSQMVGTYNLTAQFLPMDEALVTYETFDHDLVLVENNVFLLSDCDLYQYYYDGASLKFVKDISLPGEYELIEHGMDGSFILSGFMESVFGHDGASAQFSYEGPDRFSLCPDGRWGISWFVSGEDCELYAFHNGALNGSPFPFPEVDTISQVCIDNNYILISGSSPVDNDHYLFVYDHAGEFLMQLGGEPGGFGLGSITYAVSTENGFLALDGNMREVVLWTRDGTWIGAVDDSDLFGTSYPWLASADMTEDGSILLVLSDERPDESADEVLVFKLTGF